MSVISNTKQNLRLQRNSKNIFIRNIVSLVYITWSLFNNFRRFFVDQNYRSILLMQLFNSKNVHQTTSLTFMDRYPVIFSAAKEYFGDKNIKMLSYGCSTGEEVMTLRKYFTNSRIIGADVNKSSLAICKKLTVDDKISFIYSTTSELEKHGKYDAIFCMAVLQRKPHHIKETGITNLKHIYPFDKFEKQIIELDRLLKPGGLLVIHYSQYSLLDTILSSKYKVYGDYNQNDYASPIFDKNGKMKPTGTPQNSIFIKKDFPTR
ncbi:class I SAM-dependent methyltransferase [Litchfieldia alkalitelluris]|uniref:class I SAM-dependent methyltransferase n=1 Tax=Litchfieldia alkalitelluris TaxID=304268 RepID=UPI0009965857|nr:methyltransferase domain-containing protein [Litchfieldia alkalitelluris]